MKRYKIIAVILVSLAFCSVTCMFPGRQDRTGSPPADNVYAQRFSIVRKDGYKILNIYNPWQGAENIKYTYCLLERGMDIPAGFEPDQVVYIPLERIICMSTTYIPMIAELGKKDIILGISGSYLVYDKQVTGWIEDGRVKDVGYEENINKELVLQISPDLVMTYGIGSESAGYMSKLEELGVRIMLIADYLEEDPLGKAEWIRVIGALLGRDQEAAVIFREISEEYLRLKDYVKENIKTRPGVMLGLPWKDTWFISPGNSYISRLIYDAGGNYLWSDTESEVSMPFGLENVYMKAVQAQYWINAGTAGSRDEISVLDKRLESLPPFVNGNIFNNNKRISESGGNDYWESGNLHPEIILKDIAIILHPELFPGDSLYYYRKIY